MSRYNEDKKRSKKTTILRLPLTRIIFSGGSDCTLCSLLKTSSVPEVMTSLFNSTLLS